MFSIAVWKTKQITFGILLLVCYFNAHKNHHIQFEGGGFVGRRIKQFCSTLVNWLSGEGRNVTNVEQFVMPGTKHSRQFSTDFEQVNFCIINVETCFIAMSFYLTNWNALKKERYRYVLLIISRLFKWCFVVASPLVICAGVWFYFITNSNSVMIYPAVVLLGAGFSSTVVNSLSFATELIGDNKVR